MKRAEKQKQLNKRYASLIADIESHEQYLKQLQQEKRDWQSMLQTYLNESNKLGLLLIAINCWAFSDDFFISTFFGDN